MSGACMLLATAASPVTKLTPAGLVMMLLCVGLVLGLNAFCLMRVLRSSNNDD